ncbi:hypothetical protein LCGC14_0380850 [marine sediment metagenome]|uniref:Uncharacterized protein n=1 Tax=marine sediment metagenome TaxID=412755 RepID=A0A0F9T8F9_9ZZZZ
MKIFGIDFGKNTDKFSMTELEITGDYKAPVPQNVKLNFRMLKK